MNAAEGVLTIAVGAAVASVAAAYAYRERIQTALIPRVVGSRAVITNCVFDGTVSVRGPLDYCERNTFNVTGLSISNE